MLFNVFARDDRGMLVAPTYAPLPVHVADDPGVRHVGYADVAFRDLSTRLAARIADDGYGQPTDADEARMRATMWPVRRG
jgi:hypothetical protein